MKRLSFEEQQNIVKAACDELPVEFGLRTFPDARFRVNERDSYWNESLERPIVVFDVLKGGRWLSFSKGSVSEIKAEMTK
jgi:hypothetical protein